MHGLSAANRIKSSANPHKGHICQHNSPIMSRKEGNFSPVCRTYWEAVTAIIKKKKNLKPTKNQNKPKKKQPKTASWTHQIFYPLKNNLTLLENLWAYSPTNGLVALYSHELWGSPKKTTGKIFLQDNFSKHDSISIMNQKLEKSILACNTNHCCMSWTSIHTGMLLAVHDGEISMDIEIILFWGSWTWMRPQIHSQRAQMALGAAEAHL